ncbi:hypothetical protein BLNAU_22303 [Blattamonas nauphoetae]|uniref:Uncharacterized protein n=1 Tax=Blattamonas nauphoetae TaxID=2049346 RepID=A0ABQ9WTF7_9EUKA|nr:hypothetical protein BLNAU_22303 [Blattamonas nauphoetae]
MDCSAFLNWDEGKFDSLQPSPDASLDVKAVKFLESVKPKNHESPDALLNSLASNSDASQTDFVQSIVVLISSASNTITVAAMKMLDSLILFCSPKIHLALVKADLIPQVINSLNLQSLSFAETVDLHTRLMSWIPNSFWLATPNCLAQLGLKDENEQQAVHETVLKQVVVPLEKLGQAPAHLSNFSLDCRDKLRLLRRQSRSAHTAHLRKANLRFEALCASRSPPTLPLSRFAFWISLSRQQTLTKSSWKNQKMSSLISWPFSIAAPSPPTPSHSPLPLPHHPHPPTPLCLSLTTHTLPLPSASPSPPTPSHSPLPLPHHPHPPTPLCLSLTTHTLPLLSAPPSPPTPSHSLCLSLTTHTLPLPLPLPHHPHPRTPLCLSLSTHTLALPSASPSPPTPSHSPLSLHHHPHPPTPLCLSLTTHALPLFFISSDSVPVPDFSQLLPFSNYSGTERDDSESDEKGCLTGAVRARAVWGSVVCGASDAAETSANVVGLVW